MYMMTKYFSDRELSCRANGELVIPRSGSERECFLRTLELADKMREEFGGPLTCLSGYRTAVHNLRVGGALRSMHRILALDLRPADWDPIDRPESELVRLHEIALKNADGVGRYSTFIHVDLRQYVHRRPAQWTQLTEWSPT